MFLPNAAASGHANPPKIWDFPFPCRSCILYFVKIEGKEWTEALDKAFKKANDMGITDIIHCGDISEGVYPSSSLYNDTIFLHDVTSQSDYIVDNYQNSIQ